ncbi:MAG: hypothetical protein IT311_12520 [Anaerolineales bacterium]|nr:hypothetical protein [Anaerolineales bacterium]MCZ2123026.1 hypothetical protein [Anaerolineales bacterium]
MLERWNPIHILILAFLLMMLGVILPFLMVIHVLESTFFLNFFAYGSSTLGFMLGIAGVALHWRGGKK